MHNEMFFVFFFSSKPKIVAPQYYNIINPCRVRRGYGSIIISTNEKFGYFSFRFLFFFLRSPPAPDRTAPSTRYIKNVPFFINRMSCAYKMHKPAENALYIVYLWLSYVSTLTNKYNIYRTYSKAQSGNLNAHSMGQFLRGRII